MSNIVSLRPYQVNGIFKLKEKIAFDKKKRIILYCPTGGGKGLVMAELVRMALSKGSKPLTILYGSDLILQTQENYKRYYNIESQVIMGSKKSDVQDSKIASISTLTNRNLPDADFIIIDECHQTNSPSYKKIFEHYKDKIIIGLSATPFNELQHFEDYVKLASVQELVDMGFLVKPRLFKAKRATVNTDGLRVVRGDFIDDELEREASKITGDVVQEWIDKGGPNRPTVMFCVNVKHSLEVCQAFNDAGFRFVHIDGTMTNEERSRAIKDLSSGLIHGITNVMVFATGVDCPIISCVGLIRPTHSTILFIQTIGRGLRPYLNKTDCIILDYANNWTRHGLPNEDREVSIVPEKKKRTKQDGVKSLSLWLCEKCYYPNTSSVKICEDCGTEKKIQERKIKTEDGELEEITGPLPKINSKRKLYMGHFMPHGKHEGARFDQLPYSYLQYMSANMDEDKRGVKHRLEEELRLRDNG